MNEQPVAPPPAAGAILPQWAVLTLTALVGLGGTVLTVAQFVELPKVVLAVAGSIVGIGAMFGIMSPGVRKVGAPAAPSNVVSLEQAAETLRKGPPAP